MGLLGPDAVVAPPEITPPLHGLLDTALPANDPAGVRWEMGFSFAPEMCSNGGLWVPCQERIDISLGLDGSGSGSGDQLKLESDADSFIEFVPYVVWDERTCDTRGMQVVDIKGQALRRLEATQHKQIEYEFWTGEQMNQATYPNGDPVANIALVNSVDTEGVLNPDWNGGAGVPTAVSPKVALRLLTQALANCASGSRGMIHGTPYLVEGWGEDDNIIESGGKLQTKTRGNFVVSGAGYPGTGPNIVNPDPAEADPSLVWTYATGMVNWRLSEIALVPDEDELAEAIDRRINEIAYRAERFAAAVWDDCCTFAVLVDLCAADGC